jgi:hypothetical protein
LSKAGTIAALTGKGWKKAKFRDPDGSLRIARTARCHRQRTLRASEAVDGTG